MTQLSIRPLHAERGALHLFAILVLLVSIAQVVYLRHLLDALNASQDELKLAREQITELQTRLSKVEGTTLRDQVQQLAH